MARIEIALGKAATLLGYSEQGIAALADGRVLDARGEGDARVVSLQSLARFVGTSAEHVAVRGLRQAVEDADTWARVFEDVPQAASAQSPAGRTLRRALAIADIRSA
jgi:hypothetical protein